MSETIVRISTNTSEKKLVLLKSSRALFIILPSFKPYPTIELHTLKFASTESNFSSSPTLIFQSKPVGNKNLFTRWLNALQAKLVKDQESDCYEDVFVFRRRTGQYIVTKRRNKAGNTTRDSLSISRHSTRSWPVSASNQATC